MIGPSPSLKWSRQLLFQYCWKRALFTHQRHANVPASSRPTSFLFSASRRRLQITPGEYLTFERLFLRPLSTTSRNNSPKDQPPPPPPEDEDKDRERDRNLALFKTMMGFVVMPSLILFLSNRDGGEALSLIHISEPTRQSEISYAVF